jgi:hypothetical protein
MAARRCPASRTGWDRRSRRHHLDDTGAGIVRIGLARDHDAVARGRRTDGDGGKRLGAAIDQLDDAPVPGHRWFDRS